MRRTRERRRSERSARILVLCSAAAGIVHGAFSLAWAAGSTWLLDTVGDAAPDMTVESGVSPTLVLLAVGLAKIVAAVVPVLVVYGRMPRLPWRVLCAVGGVVLLMYGVLNTVVPITVLVGVIVPDGGYDRAAMVGHAFLWGPLFAAWGGFLLCALWLTRTQGHAGAQRRVRSPSAHSQS